MPFSISLADIAAMPASAGGSGVGNSGVENSGVGGAGTQHEPSVADIIRDAESGKPISGSISFEKLLAVYCAVEEQKT